MATAKEHGRIVLSGIIPGRLDLLIEALSEVTEDHFVDPMQKRFWLFLERFYNTASGVLSRTAVEDILARVADAGRRALYLETYDDFAHLKIDDADFRWSVHELKELAAEAAMRGALERSMEILVKGVEDKSGEVIKGQEASREFLLDAVADIDDTLGKQEAPHGNMRDELEIIVREYDERREAKLAGTATGIHFGISELDRKVGGLQRGELALSAGYSSDGKTSLCVQLAWSTMVEQNKNVLFFTTETVREVIRRKVIARHSKFGKFADFGLPDGLNTRAMKDGTLSEQEYQLMLYAAQDFTASADYGNLYIHQVPRNSSMDEVAHIMAKVQKKYPLDLVVCDYLALLRPAGPRNTDRESLSGILKNAKVIATTFNKGEGVPFISPWQVSRSARERAEDIGQYSLASLAETAEATNTPDVIVSLLAPVDNTNRHADVIGQVLKHRDGETANGIEMSVDYATSHFRSKLGLGGLNFNNPASVGGLDTYLNV